MSENLGDETKLSLALKYLEETPLDQQKEVLPELGEIYGPHIVVIAKEIREHPERRQEILRKEFFRI